MESQNRIVSGDSIAALLRKTSPFSSVPDGALRALADACTWLRFLRKEAIFTSHDPPERIWLLDTGIAAIVSPHGHEPVMSNLETPGNLFGCIGRICKERHSLDALALTGGRALGIPAPLFARLLERHPKASYQVTKLLARRLRESNLLRAILRRRARPRTAGARAWLRSRLGDELPLNRAELASILGLTPETTIRMLRPLGGGEKSPQAATASGSSGLASWNVLSSNCLHGRPVFRSHSLPERRDWRAQRFKSASSRAWSAAGNSESGPTPTPSPAPARAPKTASS